MKFEWDKVIGAEDYEIALLTQDAATLWIVRTRHTSIPVSEVLVNPETGEYRVSGQFKVQVRAIRDGAWGEWSDVKTFTLPVLPAPQNVRVV